MKARKVLIGLALVFAAAVAGVAIVTGAEDDGGPLAVVGAKGDRGGRDPAWRADDSKGELRRRLERARVVGAEMERRLPSPDEEALTEQERLRRSLNEGRARMDELIAKEQEDRGWTEKVTGAAMRTVEKAARLGTRLEDVRCGATACRVRMVHEGAAALEEFAGAAGMELGAWPGAGAGFAVADIDEEEVAPDGSLRLLSSHYFMREGHSPIFEASLSRPPAADPPPPADQPVPEDLADAP